MVMTLLSLVGTACGIVSVICFIILIVKMFQAGDPGMAILSLLLCICGIGFLVAIVIGWVNVDKYKSRGLRKRFVITSRRSAAIRSDYNPAVGDRSSTAFSFRDLRS